MEAVLNSGMQFIGGLLEMATGRKMTAKDDDDGRMVRIDKATGEVTLEFKLPGFYDIFMDYKFFCTSSKKIRIFF